MPFIEVFEFIRSLYPKNKTIALHEPCFIGNEKVYLEQCIDSGYISSIGNFVNILENKLEKYCNINHAIATTNGTSALHAALYALNINHNNEVITQPLSFIATSNAIAYTGAQPIYIDIDLDTLGMSPNALESFLNKYATKTKDGVINKTTKKNIKACVPMHTFGHPSRIKEILEICNKWGLHLVEDAAESLGSFIKNNDDYTHVGSHGICSIVSFNGNKIVTSGGGGAILTNNKDLAMKLKHITTTAKIPHPYKYNHDMIGFNYRLPNINAAIAVAQLEKLDFFLENKLKTAKLYEDYFYNIENIDFISARKDTKPNFWLNAILLDSKKNRDLFLESSNSIGIMTRPAWTLNNNTIMFNNAQTYDIKNAIEIYNRLVNIPSSVRI